MKRVIETCFYLLISVCSVAQIKLPQLIRDSMILQRYTKINMWGWASNGEKISIQFNGKTYKTITGNDGKWKLQMAPQHAGGPYEMEIAGKNKIILHDILIGDVWICSGQSNMEHQMKLHDVYYAKEIASANYPQIKQFIAFQNKQIEQNVLLWVPRCNKKITCVFRSAVNHDDVCSFLHNNCSQ